MKKLRARVIDWLDELTRNDRERSGQIEQLIGVMTSIPERYVVEGEPYQGAEVNDRVAAFKL